MKDKKYTIEEKKEQILDEIMFAEKEYKEAKKNNLKVYSKRIFKTGGLVLASVAPFVVTAGLLSVMIGSIPFYRDTVKEHVYKDGSLDSNGIYEEVILDEKMKDEYEYIRVYIHTPWDSTTDGYERIVFKYDFKVTEDNINKLKYCVANNNHELIRTMAEDPVIGKQATKSLPEGENNDYYTYFEYFIKTETGELVRESSGENAMGTLISLGFATAIEAITAGRLLIEFGAKSIKDAAKAGYIEETKIKKTKVKALKKKLKNQ